MDTTSFFQSLSEFCLNYYPAILTVIFGIAFLIYIKNKLKRAAYGSIAFVYRYYGVIAGFTGIDIWARINEPQSFILGDNLFSISIFNVIAVLIGLVLLKKVWRIIK